MSQVKCQYINYHIFLPRYKLFIYLQKHKGTYKSFTSALNRISVTPAPKNIFSTIFYSWKMDKYAIIEVITWNILQNLFIIFHNISSIRIQQSNKELYIQLVSNGNVTGRVAHPFGSYHGSASNKDMHIWSHCTGFNSFIWYQSLTKYTTHYLIIYWYFMITSVIMLHRS